MGVELLIKPGRSAFMDSDTQKIGSCTVGTGAVPVLMFAVAGATIKWPGPSHAGLSFLWRRESKNVGSVSKSNRTRRRDRCCRPASPRSTAAVKSHIVSASSFARPPSSAAQAFSSCSKNRATRSRTLSVSRSFVWPASLLCGGLNLPLGLSGSPPKKRRIDAAAQRDFPSKSSKK